MSALRTAWTAIVARLLHWWERRAHTHDRTMSVRWRAAHTYDSGKDGKERADG